MSLWEKIGGAQNDGLYRHTITKKIKFRKYREGKGEIDRSLKTSDLTMARRRRDELIVELWGDQPKVQRRLTNRELWPTWRDGKAQTKSAGTMSSIDASWKNLDPYAGDMFPDEITEDWWLTVYIPRKREEPSLRTGKANPDRKFMNERKWLLAFLNHLKRQDVIKKVPNLVNPDPPRDRAEIFTEEEFGRLLDNADWSLMAKLVMGRDHFMRRSEVAFLTWDRVDRVNRTIHLRAQDTKIRKPRTFPYNESLETLFGILKAEQERAGVDSPFVFPSPTDPAKSILKDGFNTAWRNCKRKAKVPARKKFHWLRHTGLTNAFKRQRLGAAQICTFAGLSLEEAQKTYLHFTTDDLRGIENLVGGS
jgi:integrase